MNGLVLSIVASCALIAVAVVALFVIGNLGGGKQIQHTKARRLVTPYVPPANSRPNDFDEWNRPW